MSDIMSEEIVLRLPRSDSPGDYVLVNVVPQRFSPLDLKLIATEGEAPYVGSVTQSVLKKIRTKNYQGDDEEWQDLIAWVFLRKRLEGRKAKTLIGLETVAAIDGASLTITLRKNISGITQRLGTITLKQDDLQAIELFDWAGTAAAATTALESEVATLSAKYHDQQEALAKLNGQLESLIKAKEEHENELLQKFMELLNAKKLKIRDQQRLLTGAKVNLDKAEQVKGTRRSNGPRKAASSRPGKRKADVEPVAADSGSDEDDFERMDLDKDKSAEEEQEDPDRASTPDKSDLDATEDEDEDEADFGPGPAKQPTKSGISAKGKVIEVAKQQSEANSQSTKASPPPRRELPFTQKRTAKEAPKGDLPNISTTKSTSEAPNAVEEEDTEGETDDDEL